MIRRSAPILLLSACFAGGAFVPAASAQDMTFSPAATEECLAESGDRNGCVGQSAELCMEDSPGGYSTMGMNACIRLELEYWDDRLNVAYGELMAQEKTMDAELAADGTQVSSVAEALREMQRAWIPFRDASCAYERARWTNGSGAGPAEASCLMVMTGRQALALEDWMEGL
ncbi:MAG: DUF1311 domain-containing protein [Rhodobacteraceae bacterium]|nr:DUF1311 domain-containing protein [Paracoccaceae bacterium]